MLSWISSPIFSVWSVESNIPRVTRPSEPSLITSMPFQLLYQYVRHASRAAGLLWSLLPILQFNRIRRWWYYSISFFILYLDFPAPKINIDHDHITEKSISSSLPSSSKILNHSWSIYSLRVMDIGWFYTNISPISTAFAFSLILTLSLALLRISQACKFFLPSEHSLLGDSRDNALSSSASLYCCGSRDTFSQVRFRLM